MAATEDELRLRDQQAAQRAARDQQAAGVSASAPYTVVVRLKSPVGVFPYLVSQTTYQAPIQTAADAAKPGS